MTNRAMAKGSSVCRKASNAGRKMAERFGEDEFRSVFALPKALRRTSVARAGASEYFGDE